MNESHPILMEAYHLMEQLDPDPAHARQVHFLAGHLFQQLMPQHQLEQEDLLLLKAAALLHDIGWSRSENGSGHHKHSADLIREHSWSSLNPEQVDLVAQTARYHRKALPKMTHQGFFRLRPGLRHKLLSLAALLRLADALDRSHQGVVRSLECYFEAGNCQILVHCFQEAEAETRAVEKKRDLFELHFSAKIGTIFLTGEEKHLLCAT
jgi:exopolyphosphatase / guanosine-5'-triphosphate,3'-diphosphate pyrophosphatase